MTAPLHSVLVKPAGPDCNCRCGYCFYLDRATLFGPGPHRMSRDTLVALVRGVMAAAGPEVSFVWQGGEPTLVGLDFFREVVALQDRYAQGRAVGNALQTNGLLLDDAWAGFLAEHHFLVGLSVDGPPEVHDAQRRTAGGEPTWARVVAASERLRVHGVETNLLAVVNDRSVEHPDAVYGLLARLGWSHLQLVPAVDHLPDGGLAAHVAAPDAFGRFLCRVFDRWWADRRDGAPTTSVRRFDALVRAMAGLPAPQCTMRPTCGDYLVVEHDGSVYSCDFFVDRSHHLGSVHHDAPGALLGGPRQRVFGEAKANLDGVCGACEWQSFCHGGCPGDRVAHPDGFRDHHCAATRALLAHAGARLGRLADRLRDETPRNAPCPCGSGLRFKRCCGRR